VAAAFEVFGSGAYRRIGTGGEHGAVQVSHSRRAMNGYGFCGDTKGNYGDSDRRPE
jgi:hypothetical protein